jgi:protein-S-isoprenylcysteine O-methyltransferase Ste14
MKATIKSGLPLTLLAVVFAIALTYASVELPAILNSFLHNIIDFPGYDSSHEIYRDETTSFMDSYYIRIIGYICLAVIVVLIIVGFITKKSGLVSAGAIAIFLPVFGHFSFNMFFLAGLGAMRIVWMPILDISYDILRLGDIAYLPYMIAVYLPALIGIDITTIIPYIIMGAGILIFILGTQAWMFARFSKKGVVTFWIYRFSRHPQYLGWIIWSYGLLIYLLRNSTLIHFKLTYEMPSSLPWLITSLVIICVALLEETKMKQNYPEEYENYKKQAPFLFPIPRFISKIITLPVKIILRKEELESGKDVAIVFLIYFGIMILLSLLFNAIDLLPRSGLWGFPDHVLSNPA